MRAKSGIRGSACTPPISRKPPVQLPVTSYNQPEIKKRRERKREGGSEKEGEREGGRNRMEGQG